MSKTVNVETYGLRALADRIGFFAGQVATIQARALNKAAANGRTAAKREIVAQVSLKSAYVLDRLNLRKASKDNQVAIIATTRRGISLANYSPRQLTRAVKDTKRSKGDALRGIAAGRKQAGVSVSVSQKNGRSRMLGAFMVPRLAGSVSGGNGMGIFIRIGPGLNHIRHLYGPSVDQVFSGVIVKISGEIASDFEAEVQRLVTVELTKLNR